MTQETLNSEFVWEKELLSPYNHLQQVKGKQLRAKILLAFNHWLKVPNEIIQRTIEIFNMIHSAALLIDDIQDYSTVRRGLPAAHCVYGLPITINSAFHVLFLALVKIHNMSAKAGKIFSELFLDVVRGQGLDIYWRENFICPTEAEYREMTLRKTGAYYVMSVRMLQCFSNDTNDYTKLSELLGTYYQIRDEYCNLSQQEALEEWPSSEDTHAKETSFCEDVTEGKFSLPVIHAVSTSYGPQILNILRQRTRDVEVKKHCLSLLEKAGSLQYTRDTLRELDASIRAEVARHGGNPALEAALDVLLSWQD